MVAAAAIPRKEADFWVQSFLDSISAVEEVVSRVVLRETDMKLVNIDIGKP